MSFGEGFVSIAPAKAADGDADGVADGLVFHASVANALEGGQKITDAGSDFTTPAATSSITILNEADALTDNVTGVGSIAIGGHISGTGEGQILIGTDGDATSGPTAGTSIGVIIIGSEANGYAAASAGAACHNSIVMGQSTALAGSSQGAVLIGRDVDGGGNNVIGIGSDMSNLGASTIALGIDVQATTTNICIGKTVRATAGTDVICFGNQTDANKVGATAIGSGNSTGAGAQATGGVGNTALGGDDGTNVGAKVTGGDRGQSFGSGSVVTASDAVNFGIGTNSTANTFQVNAMTIVPPAVTTTRAGIRLTHGTAPTSPVDGDMWTTTAGLYVRINGSTVGPLS